MTLSLRQSYMFTKILRQPYGKYFTSIFIYVTHVPTNIDTPHPVFLALDLLHQSCFRLLLKSTEQSSYLNIWYRPNQPTTSGSTPPLIFISIFSSTHSLSLQYVFLPTYFLSLSNFSMCFFCLGYVPSNPYYQSL